jgi:hypothetical protein
MKANFDPLLGNKYADNRPKEHAVTAPMHHDWAKTPIYQEFMRSPLPPQCSNSLGSLFIQAIKIRKLKRLSKSISNITPYEVKLLNKSI